VDSISGTFSKAEKYKGDTEFEITDNACTKTVTMLELLIKNQTRLTDS